jgi:hypothetical protein
MQLWREYHANEVAASSKYEGKRVQLTGKVRAITKNLFGQLDVQLDQGNFGSAVTATFEKSQESAVANLSRGEVIVFEGTVGNFIMETVMLKKCNFVEEED